MPEKLHVCEDNGKFYVQEDPEAEIYLACFDSEKEADNYVKLLEKEKEPKYSVSEVLQAAGKARSQIYEGGMDMGDFDDDEFIGMVEEILENPEEYEDDE